MRYVSAGVMIPGMADHGGRDDAADRLPRSRLSEYAEPAEPVVAGGHEPSGAGAGADGVRDVAQPEAWCRARTAETGRRLAERATAPHPAEGGQTR